MVFKKKSYRLFLSHAAADKLLVNTFETLLSKSIGLTSSEIFCSSLEGQGVPKGGSFVDEIREKAAAANAVVALITPAYLDSPFCMAELGAAWVLQTHRLPIVVPPNTFSVMEATLLGLVGVEIDNNDALAQAFEELAGWIGVAPPAAGIRQRAMRDFQRAWDSLKDGVPPPKRIEASVHAVVTRERDAALEARDAAEQELSTAEAMIEALREAKDATAVAKINEKFKGSNWQEELETAFDEIRDLYSELGGKEIVRLIILDHLGKFVRPDFNTHPEEAGRAIELDVYDEDNFRWDYNHPEVKALIIKINEITEIFEEYPEATRDFKAKKLKSDPKKIRFWEEQL